MDGIEDRFDAARDGCCRPGAQLERRVASQNEAAELQLSQLGYECRHLGRRQ
jgi:hypothetical protein